MLGACQLYADNLISNCGFESGSLAPWVNLTPTFAYTWSVSTNSPYLGTHCATTGAVVLGDTLQAIVPTNPGMLS